jgi:hypothetical protein
MGESRGRRKGGKGNGKRGDVAADRWGRVDSGTSAGMRWPAGAAARWWAESGSRPEARLAAHDRVKWFPIYLNPIFYLIQI